MKRIVVALPFMFCMATAQEKSFDTLANDFLNNTESRKEEIESIATMLKQAIDFRMKDVIKATNEIDEAKKNLDAFIDKKRKEMANLLSALKNLKPYIISQYPQIKDELEKVLN